MALDTVTTLWMFNRRAVTHVADIALALCQRDMIMVHLEWTYLPVACSVTSSTIVGGGNVAWRLTDGDLVIVTADTLTQCLVMIHTHQRYPGDGSMAGFAQVGGRDMARRLAGRMYPVMAGNAVIHDSPVIKHGGYPGGGIVAIVTFIPARQVLWWFTWGRRAVMTAVTSSEYLRVIHPDNRTPTVDTMAGITIVG